MHHAFRTVVGVAAAGIVWSPARAADVYVDTNAAPNGNGTSSAPYDTLEEGLAHSGLESDDIIHVAQGTYVPSGNVFELSALDIKIQGGYPTGFTATFEPEAYPTILSADVNGNDGPGFTNRGDNRTALLSGTDVDETIIAGITFRGCDHATGDSAFVTQGVSAPRLEQCRFIDNHNGGATARTQPGSRVRNCVFAGNKSSAGAISCNGLDDTQVVGVILTDHAVGRALDLYDSSAGDSDFIAVNSVIAGNAGGGLEATGLGTTEEDDLQITNCVIAGNTASQGAAVFMDKGGVNIFNSTIVANTASSNGGAIYLDTHSGAPALIVSDSILYENRHGAGHAGDQVFISGNGDMTIRRTDVEDGTSGFGGTTSPTYDPTEFPPSAPLFVEGPSGTWDGAGTWDRDTNTTTFVDADATEAFGDWHLGDLVTTPLGRYAVVASASGTSLALWGDWTETEMTGADYAIRDLRLSVDSPCHDAFTTFTLPRDLADLDGDQSTADALPRDFDGEDRVAGALDLGAFESCQCEGDVAGPFSTEPDCVVDVVDLLAVLGEWGCTSACTADTNGDGVVNVSDLLDVLGTWGCGESGDPEGSTFCAELQSSGLDCDDDFDLVWDTLGNGSQGEIENLACWLDHYINYCSGVLCMHQASCPSADPFGHH